MSIQIGELTVPFEITTGFRKKVANTLNIAFSDLPESNRDFISLVLNNMYMDLYIVDTVSEEAVDITCYISDKVPEELLPITADILNVPMLPLEDISEDNPVELEVVPVDDPKDIQE